MQEEEETKKAVIALLTGKVRMRAWLAWALTMPNLREILIEIYTLIDRYIDR